MGNEYAIDLSQNIPNALTASADAERAKLLPRNDYVKDANEYSSTNKDAIADGDRLGRGTGVFLDVYNESAGTIEDITERKMEIKINKFNSSEKYPNFPLG
jgi:hypothetical protein